MIEFLDKPGATAIVVLSLLVVVTLVSEWRKK